MKVIKSREGQEYYNFTPEEKEQAKQMSTLEYLERTYGYHFSKAGTMQRCREHDSLIVRADGKGWYWNSRGFGGSDVIEFMRKVENKTYEEALMTLFNVSKSNYTAVPQYKKAAAPPPSEQEKDLQMPPAVSGKYKRVFAYLTKTRCISSEIVNELMHKKYLYEDVMHNCVFVGYGPNKLPAYATVRGTLTGVQYRKDAPGSDKSISFFLMGEDKTTVNVFESPIDLLSHATMCNIETGNSKEWLKATRLSLAGVSDKALDTFLKNHPDVKRINLRLDNDLAGRKACEVISDKYKNQGYYVSVILPRTKDYNEDLCKFSEQHSLSETQLKLPTVTDNKIAFDYLVGKLGIAPEIVTTLINKNYICADNESIAFIGHNKNGAAAYAATLNTKDNSVTASGSRKNGFYIKGYDKNKVIVYKSATDLLKDATTSNIAFKSKREWLNTSRLSLDGTDDTALQNFLAENPEVNQVVFMFGNDEIDIETSVHFLQKYSDQGYSCSYFDDNISESLAVLQRQNLPPALNKNM